MGGAGGLDNKCQSGETLSQHASICYIVMSVNFGKYSMARDGCMHLTFNASIGTVRAQQQVQCRDYFTSIFCYFLLIFSFRKT